MKSKSKFFLAALLVAASAHARMSCPDQPVQAQRDSDTQVAAAVGRIGPAKAADLSVKIRTETRDLLGKLPDANVVYLEQMMLATLCSAIRESSLPDAEKINRIEKANAAVRRTFAESVPVTQRPAVTAPSRPQKGSTASQQVSPPPPLEPIFPLPAPVARVPAMSQPMVFVPAPQRVPDMTFFAREWATDVTANTLEGPKLFRETMTWRDLWMRVGPLLMDRPADDRVRTEVQQLYAERLGSRGISFLPAARDNGQIAIRDADWQALRVLLRGAGLVVFEQRIAVHWSETEIGRLALEQLYKGP